MELKTQLAIIGAIIAGVVTFLASFFIEEVRQWITSTLGISAYDFVSYTIIGLLVFTVSIFVVLLNHRRQNRKLAEQLPLTKMDSQTWSEMIGLVSDEKMRQKRKNVVAKTKVIKHGNMLPNTLVQEIEDVALYWDRMAVRLSIDENAEKRMFEFVGADVIVPFWLAIKPYIYEQRQKTIRKNFIHSFEQLAEKHQKYIIDKNRKKSKKWFC
jgi:hypothetical protein